MFWTFKESHLHSWNLILENFYFFLGTFMRNLQAIYKKKNCQIVVPGKQSKWLVCNIQTHYMWRPNPTSFWDNFLTFFFFVATFFRTVAHNILWVFWNNLWQFDYYHTLGPNIFLINFESKHLLFMFWKYVCT